MINGKCGCRCNAQSTRAVACDTDCAYGGTEDALGNCICKFANQDGTYPHFCRTCKPGYFVPQFGCHEYCVDAVTCPSGYCALDTQNTMKVSCHGCSAHHRGDIVPIVLQSNNVTTMSDSSGAFPTVTYSFKRNAGELRTAIITAVRTTKAVRAHQLIYSAKNVTVQLDSADNATIVVNSKGRVALVELLFLGVSLGETVLDLPSPSPRLHSRWVRRKA